MSAPVAREHRFLQYSHTLRWFMKNGFENCQICGTNEDLTFDHIIPRSWGGTNEMDNLCILCKKCNGMKSDRYFFNLQPLSFLKPSIPTVYISELEAGMYTLHGYIEAAGFLGEFDGKMMYSIEFSGDNHLLEVMDGLSKRNAMRRKAFVNWPGDLRIALDPRFCLV